MHLITKKRLSEFTAEHPDADNSLTVWRRTVEQARWTSLQDKRLTYSSADSVGNLTIFNIGGNKYRLVTAIDYKRHKVYIRAILTHAEYSTGRWKNDPWYTNAPYLQ